MIPVSCDPEGKLDRVPLDQIEEFQGNLKSLGKTEYAKLKQSITEKGFCVPCFAWRNGSDKWKLLDGHQRVRVIRNEGWEIDGGIPIVEIAAEDERDAKEKLLAIVSRYGRVEGQGLYEFLDGTGIDLEQWAVPDLPDLDLDSWLDEFMRDPEVPQGDPEAVPEVPEEATTQLGDLWVLGDHRVLCGDATSVDDVENLMDGEVATLMVTDPPYGIGYNYESHDDRDNEQNAELVRDAFALFQCGRVWTPGLMNLARDIARFGTTKVLAWSKKFAAAGNGLGGASTWEPILVQKPPEQKLKNDVIEIMTDRATISGESLRDLHPCPKPVDLYAHLIDAFCANRSIIADPFLGSGTTLIAAEKQGRRCFGLEIEPKYVDVIVKRWEDYTGKTAVLEQSKAA